MPLILGANSATGNYTVKDSLRFNSGSSDYLSKTYSNSPTSRTTMTISTWVKRSKLSGGVTQTVIGTNGNYEAITFFTDDTIRITGPYMSAQQGIYITNAIYRDLSAWYHIVTVYDTTNATASDRMKLYVNGQRITSFSSQTNSNQNNTTSVLLVSGQTSFIGLGGAGTYIDGYLAETYIIDGQALTPSSFGQTDPSTPSSGIWIPKAYTGTYGTNGFYLKYTNSSSLGTDSSGNGNNWTSNGGIAATSQSTDTPTNNFCTLNPLYYSGSQMTGGNLQFSASGNWTPALSTINPSTGKWYAEFKITQTSSNGVYIGVTPSNIYWTTGSIRVLSNSGTWYGSDGQKYVDGTGTSYGATFTTGDIIGVALDKTNNTIVFYKNGSSQGSLNLTSSTNSGYVSLAEDLYPYPTTVQANFGSPNYSANGYTDAAGYGNFSYAVPSGYYALCSANLANFG